MGTTFGEDVRVILESGWNFQVPETPDPANNYVLIAQPQVTCVEQEDCDEQFKTYNKRKEGVVEKHKDCIVHFVMSIHL